MTNPDHTPNRHQQRRLRTRNKLLDAAKRVFSEVGFHEATVLDITEAADVSKRTLYVHFENGKDQLLEELARHSVDEILSSIEDNKATNADLPLREHMMQSMQIVFQWMEDNPRLAAIVYGPEADPALRSHIIDYIAMQIAAEMSRECTFRADSPVPIEVVAQIQSAAIAQLVSWSLTHEHHYTPADFANFIASVFYGSVLELYPEEFREQFG